MMKPTLIQWTKLYEAAAVFKKTACWEWLTNGHIVGVQNPDSGEIGYCCVMGNGGEMFGLAMYPGTQGLNYLLRMFSGELYEDPMYTQYCMLLAFDNREELRPVEYKQIKQLGLSFRGRNAWPTFRMYEPGFVAGQLTTGEQVEFFTVVLQQVVEVAKQYKSNPDQLIEKEHQQFLVRVPSKNNEENEWSNQWIEPDVSESRRLQMNVSIDELRLAKLKNSIQDTKGVWEVDYFFIPTPIDEGDRPYFPVVCVIADHVSGQIMQFGLTKISNIQEELIERFLQLVENFGVLPQEILINNEKISFILESILQKLNIPVFLTDGLPALELFREGLEDQMGS